MKLTWIDGHSDALSNGGVLKSGGHFGLARARALGSGLQVLSLFARPSAENKPFAEALRQLERLEGELALCPAPLIQSGKALKELLKSGDFGLMLSLEGADMLEGDPERLRFFHGRGARLFGLSWNNDNPFCGGIGENRLGLSALGREAVALWEALGGLVDVSHASTAGFWQALETCKRPVVASHSSAGALCAHPRNLDDKQLRALAEGGGVVGVNFFPAFLREEQAEAAVEDVARHILHVLDIGGEDLPALGSDFDGIPSTPEGLRRVEDLPNLVKALEKSGLPARQAEKILYGNWARILGENLPD
ncbi:MAG: dipeptidase [Christensenellaceae bacterium]|nr:dipeptidase [Christensenellaceae bacterium]